MRKTIVDDKYEVNECRFAPYYGFISYERGVKLGDVRVIGGKLCYANYIYSPSIFKKPTVQWERPDFTDEVADIIKKDVAWQGKITRYIKEAANHD